MKKVDLLLKNALVVSPLAVKAGAIAILGGKIQEVLLGESPLPEAGRVIDIEGAYVLPGLIDSHVHFRSPGMEYKENWACGSRAAAAAGVTCVADMPNVVPHYTSAGQLESRIAAALGRSHVDYCFHLGVSESTINELEVVDPAIVPTVKVFLAGHHTARHIICDVAALDRIFKIAARRRLPVTVHAEDAALIDASVRSHASPRDLTQHQQVYGREAAVSAVKRVIAASARHGTSAHVLHVGSSEEVDLLEQARASGIPVSFEVLSHHLFFASDRNTSLGALIKIRPPIRTAVDRARLWQAVASGAVLSIGSDHAPHTLQEKQAPFGQAPPGTPGVQESPAAFLAGAQTHLPHLDERTRFQMLARLMAFGPAKLLGLSHRKGEIRSGLDADLSVFSPADRWLVTPQTTHALCGWSAYTGLALAGLSRLTILQGEVIYDGRRGLHGTPSGRWLPVAHGEPGPREAPSQAPDTAGSNFTRQSSHQD